MMNYQCPVVQRLIKCLALRKNLSAVDLGASVLPIVAGNLFLTLFGKCSMKSALIVDDSKVIRMVARKILEEIDFSTEEAADGKEALDSCGNNMPDVVLLDWNMPVMDGLEFLVALRKTPGGGAPIVIFCTTENDIEHIQTAMEAGANEYIMKPFDSEIIQAKFAQVGLI
jgi:two-component system, chemotaxis family, chemotaxis protein CheY